MSNSQLSDRFSLSRYKSKEDYVENIEGWDYPQIAFFVERFLLESYEELMYPFLGRDRLDDFECLTDYAIKIILKNLDRFLKNPQKYSLINISSVDSHFYNQVVTIFNTQLEGEQLPEKILQIRNKFLDYAQTILMSEEFKANWKSSKDREPVIIKANIRTEVRRSQGRSILVFPSNREA